MGKARNTLHHAAREIHIPSLLQMEDDAALAYLMDQINSAMEQVRDGMTTRGHFPDPEAHPRLLITFEAHGSPDHPDPTKKEEADEHEDREGD